MSGEKGGGVGGGGLVADQHLNLKTSEHFHLKKNLTSVPKALQKEGSSPGELLGDVHSVK